MAIRINPDGTQSEITEPVEVAKIEEAREQIAAHEDKRVADAQDVLSAFVPSTEVFVEEHEIFFRDQKLKIYAKKLGYRDCAKIDAKRYRSRANGQLDYNAEHAATTGIAWQIHYVIVKDENAGRLDEEEKSLKPKWEPLYTLDQVMNLMASDDPDAKDLVYSLLSAVWITVPELSPTNQAGAANFLGAQ